MFDYPNPQAVISPPPPATTGLPSIPQSSATLSISNTHPQNLASAL